MPHMHKHSLDLTQASPEFPHQESMVGSWGNKSQPSVSILAGQQGSQGSQGSQDSANRDTSTTEQWGQACHKTLYLAFVDIVDIDGGPLMLIFPQSGAPNHVCDFLYIAVSSYPSAPWPQLPGLWSYWVLIGILGCGPWPVTFSMCFIYVSTFHCISLAGKEGKICVRLLKINS